MAEKANSDQRTNQTYTTKKFKTLEAMCMLQKRFGSGINNIVIYYLLLIHKFRRKTVHRVGGPADG